MLLRVLSTLLASAKCDCTVHTSTAVARYLTADASAAAYAVDDSVNLSCALSCSVRQMGCSDFVIDDAIEMLAALADDDPMSSALLSRAKL